jgi:HAMP domain-containing protein/CheY-like chemotaxis protein/putative methionine-R-sulfoxide reductase with GAF domain
VAVAPERQSRRRRSARTTGRTNGGTDVVEVSKRDLRELVDALRASRDGAPSVRLGDRPGAMADIAKAFDQLAERREGLTRELARVAKVIGREGRMTERVRLRAAKGTWAEAVGSVNGMIDDLVRPTVEVARVLDAVADGDLSQKMALTIEGRPLRGEFLRIGKTVNAMLDQLSSFAAEVTRVAREVGTEGVLGGQARVRGVSGIWRELTDNVNFMANNLTTQVRNIAEVTTAVANGDLSKKITVDVKGEVLELKNTINTMVDQLSSFADEVTRVAREVGTEGILGGQAHVRGVSGTWKDLTDNVNFMASNLTTQVRGIARVVTAVADGNLNQKFTIEAKGEVAALADTINSMIDTLRVFAEQVTTVAREVGTEGKLGGQADVPGVAGTWKALTDSVNGMASNLTSQVRNIAEVTTAVANGDLSKKITVDVKGEVLALKNTINTMVDQLSRFADEVSRVAREVGTEGRLGGQAQVKGVSGTWRDLTNNVNQLANNLTNQVRNIAGVTTAVARGDLSRKITVDASGEILELKNTINTMVDQLSSFADEVTRVAREVGTEGMLGGQASVPGVSGTWKALTDNVNAMANNLTNQVRNIADVTTAVAKGDLSKQITVDARGEILELKNTINTMVDQLSTFADEVTRVAREVGTEGRLGGLAEVEDVSGTWRSLTESVNGMAGNLTAQVRNIAEVTTAVANGDLSRKITVDARGEIAQLKDTINTMVDQLSSFAEEVTRVAREVGTEGRLGGQAQVKGVSGTWKDLTDNVNTLADNLTTQVRNIADVTTAVANGDLSRKITVDVKGEILALKNTINTMVDQLSSFADEVTRVAREVGTEGKLGGQARVKGVSGTWKDLTDNVNAMADNLTNQVRNIAEVTTAVAKGDLSKQITVDARGEIARLKNTINTMVEQLSSFAAEVTRVAKEVGVEGRLGVQAEVGGVSGVWKGLTDNVNQLAATLTTQLRAISEVSQAVTQGDLTRSIAVEAQGEVAELKDTINKMIENLAGTTRANQEQDWLNSNMARFTGMLQGERDLETVSRLIMSELTPLVGAGHGAFFLMESPDGEGDDFELRLIATYGYKERKNVSTRFKIGEGLVGQAALEQKSILLTQAPEDYIKITSGLGEAAPVNVIVLPVLFEDQVMGVIELASFGRFTQVQQAFLDQLGESIGVVLNTIEANMRTEELLEQSQQLTMELQSQSEELQAQQEELQQTNKELEEQAASLKASEELLQTQQEELQQTNEELEEKAQLLAEQNRRIEIKNREIELARVALEEKAEQLALSSRYKSEFLANMSHELRTPLNSLLILAKLLAENPDANLTEKQVEFANTIYAAGSDLLDLINDILDLSKVEAGRMDVHVSDVAIADLREFVERSFRPVADDNELTLDVEVHGANVPPTIETDEQRLQQILKNLLSNAFKFTREGGVTLRISAAEDEQFARETLAHADTVLAFSVADTGVGIHEDKLNLIFEAFQQADGTTSRRYGGTGLGLSISREIARLLGGEIRVKSTVGEGSTFTLFLPATFAAGERVAAGDTFVETVIFERDGGDGPTPAQGRELDPTVLLPSEVPDDRDEIAEGDRVVLIIEDDAEFAKTELEVARSRGFKGLVALRGDSGVALAHEFKPDAIILDLKLPVMDGWTVLDHLKHHPQTRHIPVHIVSAGDGRQNALKLGAAAFLEKPISKDDLEQAFAEIQTFIDRGVRTLLIVEDDEDQRRAVVELIGGGDVDVTAVGTSEQALAALDERRFDCMVLDLKLPDMGGFDLLEKLKEDPRHSRTPVIVYTGKQLTRREETKLRRFSEAIVVKDASSPERLLDETSLFLHRVERKLPQDKRRMLEQLHSADEVFAGRKILIVDDDVRNVFALTSVLESSGMEVVYAENGREAIETLRGTTDVDLVLMDIMMPEMDGYETIRAIREDESFKQLPIISLTAKAMKGDREKSIAAGASDYITKPVDTDQLLSLMRVWLYK